MAQERFDPRTVVNPAYETAYFRWGFRAANTWLERLGEAPRSDFARAADRLALPAIVDGVYIPHEKCPGMGAIGTGAIGTGTTGTGTKGTGAACSAPTAPTPPHLTDHPSMLAMLGVLPPSSAVDPAVMNATLDRVLEKWDMNSLWGWDFPVMALTAWALGRRDDALRLLLLDSPKNTYTAAGHNNQVGAPDLPIYLPGNGGVLLAVAIMAKGLAADYGAHIEGFVNYLGGD
jgi:hypothetical protein